MAYFQSYYSNNYGHYNNNGFVNGTTNNNRVLINCENTASIAKCIARFDFPSIKSLYANNSVSSGIPTTVNSFSELNPPSEAYISLMVYGHNGISIANDGNKKWSIGIAKTSVISSTSIKSGVGSDNNIVPPIFMENYCPVYDSYSTPWGFTSSGGSWNTLGNSIPSQTKINFKITNLLKNIYTGQKNNSTYHMADIEINSPISIIICYNAGQDANTQFLGGSIPNGLALSDNDRPSLTFYWDTSSVPVVKPTSNSGYMYYYTYKDSSQTTKEWKKCIPYYYTGSEWKKCIPYYYNGSEWKKC